MQPLQHRAWILPERFLLSDLEKLLSKHFTVQLGSIIKSKRNWYDSFDWRLFRKEQRLTHEGNTWLLEDFQGRQLASLTSRKKSFRFSWQFPDSPLQKALKKPLDVRGIDQIAVEELDSCSLQVFNNDKKIVAFLTLQQSTNSQNEEQQITVQIAEVRGYGKWFKRITKVLENSGAVQLDSLADLFPFVIEGTGREPLDYSSGYNVPLTPEMRSIEANRQIFSSLLTSMCRNEKGIINDFDSEFLHDLRVAVRRTRSALTLLKGVLAPDVTERFKEDFRFIGQITGPVRDLDVYLLNEESYKNCVPERLQLGLSYFFGTLAEKRKKEQRQLVVSLRSRRYQQILTDWAQLLEEDKLPAGIKGDIPIGIIAGKVIHKRFRRIIQDGSKIHKRTPDQELHKLRIQCKKLRYCLEFFATLYEPQHMKQFIRQLKMLQNNLGDFNDLSVQQEMLADYLSKLKPGSRKSQELAASIGGLMTDLATQHHWIRAHFEEAFTHFCRPQNMKLYREIFD